MKYISHLSKKGDRRDPKNYRGISVDDILCRLISKILQKKYKNCIVKLDDNQSGAQLGVLLFCIRGLGIKSWQLCSFARLIEH